MLKELEPGSNPKEVIHVLSEDLLDRFTDLPLLDRYDVYQRLMDYWAEVMQDDVYLIAADGWVEAAQPRGIIEDKERKIKETPDLVIKRSKYKMDLIPPDLIVSRYFADQQTAIDDLRVKQEISARDLEEFIEEHSGEEGLLEDAVNDKGKVTRAGVKERLKQLKMDSGLWRVEDDDEGKALKSCLELIEAEAAAGKAVKNAQVKLNMQVLAKYPTLAEDEIKTLVVKDKWFASIQAAIEGEVQRLTQRLATRIKELEERYAQPLPELEREVEAFAEKVAEHLRRMGVSW